MSTLSSYSCIIYDQTHSNNAYLSKIVDLGFLLKMPPQIYITLNYVLCTDLCLRQESQLIKDQNNTFITSP